MRPSASQRRKPHAPSNAHSAARQNTTNRRARELDASPFWLTVSRFALLVICQPFPCRMLIAPVASESRDNLTRSKGYACRVGVKMLIASFETGMEGVEGYVTARGRIGHRGLPCYESESSGLTTNAGTGRSQCRETAPHQRIVACLPGRTVLRDKGIPESLAAGSVK